MEDQDIADKDINEKEGEGIISLIVLGLRKEQGWKILVFTLTPTNRHQITKQQPKASSIILRKHLKERMTLWKKCAP